MTAAILLTAAALVFQAWAENEQVSSVPQPNPAREWLGAESNRRHVDFQSTALPTELPSRHWYRSAPASDRSGLSLKQKTSSAQPAFARTGDTLHSDT